MSLFVSNLLGFVLIIAASSVIYIASPNQQWFSQQKIPTRFSILLSVLLIAASFTAFKQNFSTLAASFTVLTALMLLLSTLPLLVKYAAPQTNQLKSKNWLTRGSTYNNHKSQWWLKTLGIVLLGFPLAVLMSGVLGFSVGDSAPSDVRTQFVMWMITPLWLIPISLIYFSARPWVVFAILTTLLPVTYVLLEWVK